MFAIWVSWSPDFKAFGSNISPVQLEELHFFSYWDSEDFTDDEMTADFTPPPKKVLKFP